VFRGSTIFEAIFTKKSNQIKTIPAMKFLYEFLLLLGKNICEVKFIARKVFIQFSFHSKFE